MKIYKQKNIPLLISLLFLIINLHVVSAAECFKLKGKFCSNWKDYYIGPKKMKKELNVTVNNVDDFDALFANLEFVPIYPNNTEYLRDTLQCSNYDLSNNNLVQYKNVYNCNNIIFTYAGVCYKNGYSNKKLKNVPKMCKSSCMAYYDSMRALLDDKTICPMNPMSELARQDMLAKIKMHCDTYTDTSSDCIRGIGDEAGYCGKNKNKKK